MEQWKGIARCRNTYNMNIGVKYKSISRSNPERSGEHPEVPLIIKRRLDVEYHSGERPM